MARRKFALCGLSLDPSSPIGVGTFVAGAAGALEEDLVASVKGCGVEGVMLGVPPLAATMSKAGLAASGAAALTRYAAVNGLAPDAATALSRAESVLGAVHARLDAATASVLDSLTSSSLADCIYTLKDGSRELWLYDSLLVSDAAAERAQTGRDAATRATAATGLGMLRDRVGAEVMLWASLPPSRVTRAKLVSTVQTPAGVAVSDARTDLSVELHKSVANAAFVLRVVRTDWDLCGATVVESVAETDAILPRLSNEAAGGRGRAQAGRAQSARPGSARPATASSTSHEEAGESKEGKDGDEGHARPDASSASSASASSQLRSVGGVISVELLALPPAGITSRAWVLAAAKVAGAARHAVKRLQHPLASQGVAAMQGQAFRVKMRLQPTVVVPVAPIMVASWQSGSGEAGWSRADITDVAFDAPTRSLSWSTVYTTPHALVMPRHTDLPFSRWDLKPAGDGSEAVVFTLQGPRFTFKLRVTDGGATLVEPALPELAHICGVSLPPGELLGLLNESGVCLSPLDSDVAHVNAREGRAVLPSRMLAPSTEAAILSSMAACAGGYEVELSAWSADPAIPAGAAVLRVREAGLPADVCAHSTSWTTVAAYEDSEVPSRVRFVATQDEEAVALARWVRRVQPHVELAAAQAVVTAAAAATNDERVKDAEAAAAAAAAAAEAAAAVEGAVEAAPVVDVPSVELVTAAVLTMADLPDLAGWSGEPVQGESGVARGSLAAALAPRTAPTARLAAASTPPLLSETLGALLALLRPISFTAS